MVEISINHIKNIILQQRNNQRDFDRIIENLNDFSRSNDLQCNDIMEEMRLEYRKMRHMTDTLEEIVAIYDRTEEKAFEYRMLTNENIGYINLKTTKRILENLNIKFRG